MTMLPDFESAQLDRRQIDLPAFDAADYRRTVLAGLAVRMALETRRA